MHRISYILYNYQERFRPDDFYIVGSNRILLNYITGVLPDLDVYGIRQMTMEQLCKASVTGTGMKKYRIRETDKLGKTGCVRGTSTVVWRAGGLLQEIGMGGNTERNHLPQSQAVCGRPA